jgi:hypothetical protein
LRTAWVLVDLAERLGPGVCESALSYDRFAGFPLAFAGLALAPRVALADFSPAVGALIR